MPYRKTIWRLASKKTKPLPTPSRIEQDKIRQSLGLYQCHPFPRCVGKDFRKVKKFEKQGDFSHSGHRAKHICDACRCKRTAGWGTKHFGVGFCYYHDVDRARLVAKSMTIALQQGYPLDPIKYKSDSEFIAEVRRMSEKSKGVLGMREELILLRTHLQEVEALWKEQDPAKKLTMRTAKGEAVEMTDDVKLTHLVKLSEAISKLSRDQYIITEYDYVSIDEVRTWLWALWQSVEKNIDKTITGEMNVNDLKIAIQHEWREIPLPKGGRKK
jgi:hypothetical protein